MDIKVLHNFADGRSWYRPAITREQAEVELSAASVGAFLVRPSSFGGLALSYKEPTNTLDHINLTYANERWFICGDETPYVTLDDLLANQPYLVSAVEPISAPPTTTNTKKVIEAFVQGKNWYRPNATRESAEAALLGAAPGTYVVRPSSVGGLALSYVEPANTIDHINLSLVDDKWYICGDDRPFDTLDALLGNQPYLLHTPAHHQTLPSAPIDAGEVSVEPFVFSVQAFPPKPVRAPPPSSSAAFSTFGSTGFGLANSIASFGDTGVFTSPRRRRHRTTSHRLRESHGSRHTARSPTRSPRASRPSSPRRRRKSSRGFGASGDGGANVLYSSMSDPYASSASDDTLDALVDSLDEVSTSPLRSVPPHDTLDTQSLSVRQVQSAFESIRTALTKLRYGESANRFGDQYEEMLSMLRWSWCLSDSVEFVYKLRDDELIDGELADSITRALCRVHRRAVLLPPARSLCAQRVRCYVKSQKVHNDVELTAIRSKVNEEEAEFDRREARTMERRTQRWVSATSAKNFIIVFGLMTAAFVAMAVLFDVPFMFIFAAIGGVVVLANILLYLAAKAGDLCDG